MGVPNVPHCMGGHRTYVAGGLHFSAQFESHSGMITRDWEEVRASSKASWSIFGNTEM